MQGSGLGGVAGGEKDTFSEMVSDFRQRLKQVMEEREDSFRKLESSISSTSKEIQVSQSASVSLSVSACVSLCLCLCLCLWLCLCLYLSLSLSFYVC